MKRLLDMGQNCSRAPEGTRTPNLSITSRLRYHCATGALRELDIKGTTKWPRECGAISVTACYQSNYINEEGKSQLYLNLINS